MIQTLLDLIFPKKCRLCGELLNFEKPLDFCRKCFLTLPWTGKNFCVQCGRYLGGGSSFPSKCLSCRQNKCFFTEGRSALILFPREKKLLIQMKYHGNFGLAVSLGKILRFALKKFPPQSSPDHVTFVPLHPLKEKERGFNQSRLFAEEIGKHFNIPVLETLERTKYEAPQARLEWKKRILNVRGNFKILPKIESKKSSIILIDDVITTGNTLNECSRELSKKGFKNIILLTLFSIPGLKKHFS